MTVNGGTGPAPGREPSAWLSWGDKPDLCEWSPVSTHAKYLSATSGMMVSAIFAVETGVAMKVEVLFLAWAAV